MITNLWKAWIVASLVLIGFSLHARAQAPVIVHPPAPTVIHKAAPHHVPQWHAVPMQPVQPEGWGVGSWFAAPFNAVGSVVGTVAAGVGNVVETPFIAAGQAWSNENCWQHMVDPHDGQIKLFWICK
jgi:hypothetical protein